MTSTEKVCIICAAILLVVGLAVSKAKAASTAHLKSDRLCESPAEKKVAIHALAKKWGSKITDETTMKPKEAAFIIERYNAFSSVKIPIEVDTVFYHGRGNMPTTLFMYGFAKRCLVFTWRMDKRQFESMKIDQSLEAIDKEREQLLLKRRFLQRMHFEF